jgi:hypothetical protein
VPPALSNRAPLFAFTARLAPSICTRQPALPPSITHHHFHTTKNPVCLAVQLDAPSRRQTIDRSQKPAPHAHCCHDRAIGVRRRWDGATIPVRILLPSPATSANSRQMTCRNRGQSADCSQIMQPIWPDPSQAPVVGLWLRHNWLFFDSWSHGRSRGPQKFQGVLGIFVKAW